MTGSSSPAFTDSSQVPAKGALNIDHVAHFAPHVDAASAALEKLGFTLTPFSPQSHRTEPGGPLVPAGTGNR
ncbi:MAG TPA: VOC family protein, partial [Burkholderiales bacterium]|nr:VOC family protein [Burkholderiales bacterium]